MNRRMKAIKLGELPQGKNFVLQENGIAWYRALGLPRASGMRDVRYLDGQQSPIIPRDARIYVWVEWFDHTAGAEGRT